MIIEGLYTFNNFIYFLDQNKEYNLYRSASKTKFYLKEGQEPPVEITDRDVIKNMVSSHNEEIMKMVLDFKRSYSRTKSPFFKRGYEMFEAAMIENKNFPDPELSE